MTTFLFYIQLPVIILIILDSALFFLYSSRNDILIFIISSIKQTFDKIWKFDKVYYLFDIDEKYREKG